MHTMKRGMRRYFVELVGTILLTFAAMYAALHVEVSNSALKAALTLSPIIPLCLAAIAIYRCFRTMDEMHQRNLLNMIAVSAAVTALFGLCYPFAQKAFGIPNLPIIFAWPVMALVWIVWASVAKWRESVAERGVAKTLAWIVGLAAAVGIPTMLYAFAAPNLGWPAKPIHLVLFATFIWVAISGGWIFSKRAWK